MSICCGFELCFCKTSRTDLGGCIALNDTNVWKSEEKNVRKKKSGGRGICERAWITLFAATDHFSMFFIPPAVSSHSVSRTRLLMIRSHSTGVVRLNRPIRCLFRMSVWTLYRVGRQETHSQFWGLLKVSHCAFQRPAEPRFVACVHTTLPHLYWMLFVSVLLFCSPL